MGESTITTYTNGSRAVITNPSLASRLVAIENEINGLFERVPFGSHSLDANGTYKSINALELAWLGYTRDEVIGKKKLVDFLTPTSQDKFRAYFAHPHLRSTVAELELELVRRDGISMPISLSVSDHLDDAHQLLNRRAVIFDLTESRAAKAKQRVSAVAFESLSGMFITDRNQVILQVNGAFTELTGYTAQEAEGQTPRLLSSGRHNKAFYQAMWAALKEKGCWHGEIWNRRKDGSLFVEWLSLSTVLDVAGEVTHYVASFIDITARKSAQDQIAHMAYHDALTQLPNRRLLQDRLNQALAAARRSGLYGALLFIDLDNFKKINDSAGHEAGDLVLVEAANRLRRTVREGDSVARLGGDEFAILLEDLDTDRLESAAKAQQLGEKIIEVLAQPYVFGRHKFHCSASIGIDLYAHTESGPDLLQHADLAMYQSKRAGRNTLRFFDQAMQTALNSHVALENELRLALEERHLQLYFQPQRDRKGKTVGAEALLRWPHGERGFVAPAEFITLAEETGLILPIGQWVLEAACAQLKEWEDKPQTQQLRLAINVSARQFRQAEFVSQVRQAMEHHAVNPTLLKLEVTESVLLDVSDTVRKMEALRALGVQLSLDDFGTGYSSLSILTQLPITQLKIDQSFVRNIGVKPSDASIIQTIISMAQILEMEVIAEGVETEAQSAFLEQQGCQLFQGVLFGPAVPIEVFEAQLA
ncbi:PAS domain S-box-containing protein/diguanylate cyclase (GGDEF) domain-containing protein [Rhodoferax sp. OV413]|uniref:sensor domain-containing protein n=1 Tax=Rhodoferax sp. OV413 TaxID=1855285 RepID=UPI0008896638|nr:EAL domain-containing protein [Rhodoferax sp. OV413]SDO44483.1 PAS domain S-box-containing protein/diguanylate cyclase (GGDEF) domain-containing protein [Rhodoferax sp. OV413]